MADWGTRRSQPTKTLSPDGHVSQSPLFSRKFGTLATDAAGLSISRLSPFVEYFVACFVNLSKPARADGVAIDPGSIDQHHKMVRETPPRTRNQGSLGGNRNSLCPYVQFWLAHYVLYASNEDFNDFIDGLEDPDYFGTCRPESRLREAVRFRKEYLVKCKTKGTLTVLYETYKQINDTNPDEARYHWIPPQERASFSPPPPTPPRSASAAPPPPSAAASPPPRSPPRAPSPLPTMGRPSGRTPEDPFLLKISEDWSTNEDGIVAMYVPDAVLHDGRVVSYFKLRKNTSSPLESRFTTFDLIKPNLLRVVDSKIPLDLLINHESMNERTTVDADGNVVLNPYFHEEELKVHAVVANKYKKKIMVGTLPDELKRTRYFTFPDKVTFNKSLFNEGMFGTSLKVHTELEPVDCSETLGDWVTESEASYVWALIVRDLDHRSTGEAEAAVDPAFAQRERKRAARRAG